MYNFISVSDVEDRCGRSVLRGELFTVLLVHVLYELVLEDLQTLAVLRRAAELCDVETGRVRHVHDEGVGQHHKLEVLRLQLHDVRHFVPAETHEPSVVLRDVLSYHDVRLKVGLPLYLCNKQR